MVENEIKIGRQVNKFLNSYAMQRNNAKVFKLTNLITRQLQ